MGRLQKWNTPVRLCAAVVVVSVFCGNARLATVPVGRHEGGGRGRSPGALPAPCMPPQDPSAGVPSHGRQALLDLGRYEIGMAKDGNNSLTKGKHSPDRAKLASLW